MAVFRNVMVGFTGLLVVGFTIILTATMVYFIENPIVLDLECSPDLIQWRGVNYACEVQFADGTFEQMVLWRRADMDFMG